MEWQPEEQAMGDSEFYRGYSKGYSTGAKWPLHRPPTPPDPIAAAIVRVSRELRDAVDATIATFAEDDDLVKELGSKVDAFDSVFAELGRWLRFSDDLKPPAIVP